MSPINWYVGVGVASCFGAAVALKDNPPLSTALVVVGAAVLLVGGGIATYFAVYDPNRLHSEEHLTAVRQLDLIAEKGGRIVLNPVDLAGVTSPRPLAAADRPEPTNG